VAAGPLPYSGPPDRGPSPLQADLRSRRRVMHLDEELSCFRPAGDEACRIALNLLGGSPCVPKSQSSMVVRQSHPRGRYVKALPMRLTLLAPTRI
jgi:hypothetical protein